VNRKQRLAIGEAFVQAEANEAELLKLREQNKSLKKRVRRIKTHIPKDDIFCDTELGELLDLRVPLR
jgi:hypothetical protein